MYLDGKLNLQFHQVLDHLNFENLVIVSSFEFPVSSFLLKLEGFL